MVWIRRRGASSGEIFSSTRSRISAAALRVKVMATISSGSFTVPSIARKRWTSSVVFPDPAGAWIMNERPGASARSRCFWSATVGLVANARG